MHLSTALESFYAVDVLFRMLMKSGLLLEQNVGGCSRLVEKGVSGHVGRMLIAASDVAIASVVSGMSHDAQCKCSEQVSKTTEATCTECCYSHST